MFTLVNFHSISHCLRNNFHRARQSVTVNMEVWFNFLFYNCSILLLRKVSLINITLCKLFWYTHVFFYSRPILEVTFSLYFLYFLFSSLYFPPLLQAIMPSPVSELRGPNIKHHEGSFLEDYTFQHATPYIHALRDPVCNRVTLVSLCVCLSDSDVVLFYCCTMIVFRTDQVCLHVHVDEWTTRWVEIVVSYDLFPT